jgi:hypothetical protein
MVKRVMLKNFKKYNGSLLVLAFFILASLLYTYPLIRCMGSCVRNMGDPLLNAWILAWDVRQALSDPANIFNANIFYPHANTLAYSESQFANALLAAPILLITNQPVAAHNFVYFFSFVFSGFGTFLLVRHLTGCWTAGLAAGVIFTFTPYRFSHFQIQMLATQWMPFALLYLDKTFRRQRWSDFLLFALFFNLTVLSSYYYGLFFSVAIFVLGLVYILVLRREIRRWSFWGKVLFVGVVTAVINIPLALPYFSLADAGFVRDLATTELLKLEIQDFLTATPENWLYGDLGAVFRGEYWSEHIAFPGVLALLLAITALFSTRDKSLNPVDKLVQNRSLIWGYTAVFLVIIILAMGATFQIPGSDIIIPMPFQWLFNHVPGFQGLRAPSRFVIVSLFALSVLSGFGLAWLQTRWSAWAFTTWRPLHTGKIIFILLLTAMALEYMVAPIPFEQVPSTPPVYDWLAAQEENSPVIELPFPQIPVEFITTESLRLYYATIHWQPLVNGYSGFEPPELAQIRAEMSIFPDQNSISRLNELGVRYVVYHQDLLNEESQAKFDTNMQEFSQNLTPVAEFPNTTVYEVQAQGGSGVRQLIADATFGEKLKLVGFGVDQTSLTPGETITVSLLWRGLIEMTEDYTVFLHVVDQNGRLLAQQDLRLEPSTSSWQPKQLGRTQHILTIPSETKTTSVNLIVGVYQWPSLNRLPLLDKNKIPIEDKINLMSIPLETPASTPVP